MKLLKPIRDGRTPEQVRQHYEVERELATVLRNAPKQERTHLCPALYDEMLRRVPTHPMLRRKHTATEVQTTIAHHMKLMRRFLSREATYLEIGAGDCTFASAVAEHVRKVYAIDVSAELVKNAVMPSNGEIVLTDGRNIPVPRNSVHVAFSNQVMEHLHPDDAFEQLQNICEALVTGGTYICVTPNRLNGPHDVSKFFDYEARGFHLKEYTTTESALQNPVSAEAARRCGRRHQLRIRSADGRPRPNKSLCRSIRPVRGTQALRQ